MIKINFYRAYVSYNGMIWDISSQEFRDTLIEAAKVSAYLNKTVYYNEYDIDSYNNFDGQYTFTVMDPKYKTALVTWDQIDRSFDWAECKNSLQYLYDNSDYDPHIENLINYLNSLKWGDYMFKVNSGEYIEEQIVISFDNGYLALYPYKFFPCKQKELFLLCKIIDISDDPVNAIYYLSDFLTELLDHLEGKEKAKAGKNLKYILKRYSGLFDIYNTFEDLLNDCS